MSKGERTFEHVTTAALDLASTVGIEQLSIGAVAQRAGMSKSGVYAHYRSRKALQLAVLDAAGQRGHDVIAGATGVAPGLVSLRAFFEAWIGWARKAGLQGGCPFAAAMFEVDDVDSDVRGVVEDHYADLMAQLEGHVEDAVRLGELDASTDPAQVAWELGGLYLAHHTSERFFHDPAADERALTGFDTVLDSRRPTSAPRRAQARRNRPR